MQALEAARADAARAVEEREQAERRAEQAAEAAGRDLELRQEAWEEARQELAEAQADTLRSALRGLGAVGVDNGGSGVSVTAEELRGDVGVVRELIVSHAEKVN